MNEQIQDLTDKIALTAIGFGMDSERNDYRSILLSYLIASGQLELLLDAYQLSHFWFQRSAGWMPNHLLAGPADPLPAALQPLAAQLARRMAFMAQETQVAFAFSAQEVVEMGRYPHRQQPSHQEAQIVQSAMDSMGVMPMPPATRRKLRALSLSEKWLFTAPTHRVSPSFRPSHMLTEPPRPWASRLMAMR